MCCQGTQPRTQPGKREATDQVNDDGLNEVIAVVDDPSGLARNTESWVVRDVGEEPCDQKAGTLSQCEKNEPLAYALPEGARLSSENTVNGGVRGRRRPALVRRNSSGNAWSDQQGFLSTDYAD